MRRISRLLFIPTVFQRSSRFKFLSLIVFASFFISGCCDKEEGEEAKPNEHVLTIRVADQYVTDDTETWFFMSDKDGTSHDAQRVTNGATLTFKRIDSDSFIITRFTRTRYSTGAVSRTLNTYNGIYRGEYLLRTARQPETVVGTAHFKIVDVPDGNQVTVTGSVLTKGGNVSSGQLEFDVSLTDGAEDEFIVFSQNKDVAEMRSARYTGVRPGDNVSINFSDLALMNKTVLEVPDAQFVFVIQGGATNIGGEPTRPIQIEPITPRSSVELYTADFLKRYWTILDEKQGSVTNRYSYVSDILPPSFERLNAEVVSKQFSVTGFEVNSTGDFDCLLVNASKMRQVSGVATTDSRNVYCRYFSKNTFTYPLVPAEILSEYYPDGQPQHAQVTRISYLSRAGFEGHVGQQFGDGVNVETVEKSFDF